MGLIKGRVGKKQIRIMKGGRNNKRKGEETCENESFNKGCLEGKGLYITSYRCATYKI